MRDNWRLNLGRLGWAFGLWLLGTTCYAATYSVGNLGSGGTAVGDNQIKWSVGGGYTLTATAYSTPSNYFANGATTANSWTQGNSSGSSYADQKGTGTGQTTSGYLTTEASSLGQFGGYYSCSGGSTACGAIGQWQSARLVQYGGGLGISNNVSGDELSTANAPQHGIDNNGAIDVVVFSLRNSAGKEVVFDPASFKLGYVNNDADVQAWIGGNSLSDNYNFDTQNACFKDCGAKSVIGGNFGYGTTQFTEITDDITPDGGGTGGNIPANITENFSGNTSGKYLVMSGNLGLTTNMSGGNDFFKLLSMSVNVPVPATMPLLFLGLAALGFSRRRALRFSSIAR